MRSRYKQRNQKNVTIKQFNETVKYFIGMGYRPHFDSEPVGIRNVLYFKDNPRYVHCIARSGSKVYEFVADLLGAKPKTVARSSMTAVARFCKVYSPERHKEWQGVRYSNFMRTNARYDGKEIPAICFDMNCCFGWALGEPCPDFENPLRKGKAENSDEVVFTYNDEILAYGDVYRLMPSPYRDIIDKGNAEYGSAWYKTFKVDIVIFIGNLANMNNRWRNWVLYLAEKRVKDKIAEIEKAGYKVIYASTDAIAVDLTGKDVEALKKHFNVEPKIGEWKIEHTGKLRCKMLGKEFARQWVEGLNPTVKWKGLPKELFTPDFNILTDASPSYQNAQYFFSRKDCQIKGGRNE